MRKSLCTNLLRGKKTNGKNNCRICISQIQIQIRGGTGRDIVGAQLPTAALSANSTLIRRNVCQKMKKKNRKKEASKLLSNSTKTSAETSAETSVNPLDCRH